MTIKPLCMDCKHLHKKGPHGVTCDAFPIGIPMPILLTTADHRQSYPGDRGILFEPKPKS